MLVTNLDFYKQGNFMELDLFWIIVVRMIKMIIALETIDEYFSK